MIGIVRFILEFFVYPNVACGEIDRRPSIIKDIHYLHFGLILFVVCIVISVIVSLLSDPIPPQRVRVFAQENKETIYTHSIKTVLFQLHRLTFLSRYSVQERYDLDANEVPKSDMELEEPGSSQ